MVQLPVDHHLRLPCRLIRRYRLEAQPQIGRFRLLVMLDLLPKWWLPWSRQSSGGAPLPRLLQMAASIPAIRPERITHH
jgi:hypothetical protein